MDGPRLDSRVLQVRFLFDEIEMGLHFVRSAERLRNPAVRARTLLFAQHAYDTADRVGRKAPLTKEERDRLDVGLASLKGAIDGCRGTAPE